MTSMGSRFGVDQGVDLAAFHLLAGVVTHCIVVAAPFSADFTDWLSRTAAKGPASRLIHSRSAMCSSAQIASHVPSRWNFAKAVVERRAGRKPSRGR
jgi:hypothetical protein